MNNWRMLNESECNNVWNFIYERLFFQPNVEGVKLITLPVPSKCYDISKFYNNGFSDELYDNLHQWAIKCFIPISKGKRLYGLNWKHECYSFDPQLPFEKDEFDEWLISVFPNGDYIFFLTQDFKTGIFGDGINLTISFFGEDIIKELRDEQPEIIAKSASC
jgi:Protein of unknown function (DUF2716)